MTTVVLVQQGGTGSNNASDARSALGAAPTAAYDQANAAFAAANSGSSSAGAAYNQANAAYTQANTARSDANTTFATVNTTFGTVNTSVSTANTQANSGRDQANAAYGQANTSYGQANSARDQANTAYGQANLAYTQANSAFTAANNSNLKSGGIISGTLNVTNDIIVGGNVYLQGNTTFINVATYQVNDPLMYIAANNTLTDSVDIGFVGAKNTSGTFSHTGLARDATDGKYKLFDNLPDAGHVGNVIDFANSTIATLVANVEANTLTLGGNTVATQANLTLAHNQANNARTQANNAYAQANLAYTAANNAVLKAGDTMTGQLNISSGGLLVTGNTNFDSGTLFVDSVNDRIGIGTSSPSRALTIEKSGAAFPSASNPTIRLNETSSGRFAVMELDSSQNLTIWNGDTGSGSIRFYRGSGSGTLSMSLDGSGNVGIGTASPTAKLHVYTTTNYTGNLTFDGVASIGPVLNIEAPGNVYTEFRLGSWALTRAKLRVEGYSGAGSGTGGGTLSLWTGDTSGVQQQRVTIDGVGNVGIGATIPSYKLQVSGSSGTVGVGLVGTYASGDVGLYIAPNAIIGSYSAISSNPNASTGVNYIFGSANSTSSSAHSRVDISAGGASGGDPKLTYTISGVLNWSLGVDNSDSDKFKISASDSPGTSDLLTIDTSGNVGIGTTSPSQKLHVASGRIAVTNGFNIGSTDGNTGMFVGTNTVNFQTNGNTVAQFDASGNLGIGTTSPVTRLNIRYPYSGSNVTTFGKVSESHIYLGDPGWNNQYVQITFGYDSTNAAAAFGFLVTDQTGTTKGALVFATRDVTTSTLPTERMRITSAGNVGIGTTSPSTKLDVSGTITCTALTETSSITFKENVDPIQNALNSITKLVGVTYDRKDGSAKQKAGLIAEEVNEVLPNLVQKDADGNAYGIHYTNLIAYLVESIKELNNKIERLESNR